MSIREKVCSACGETVVYVFRQKPEVCPYCSSPYWSKPPDECRLFLLQEKWHENHSEEILGKMYTELVQYSKNMIKSKIKNKYRMSIEELDEKASDSANELIKKYLVDPEYVILYSFGGLLRWLVNGVLYGNAREEQHDSLNAINETTGKDLESQIEYTGIEPSLDTPMNPAEILETSKGEGMLQVYQLVERIFNKIKSEEETLNIPLLFLIGFVLRLKKSHELFMETYFAYAGSIVQKDVKNAELLLHRYLKEVLQDG